MGGGVDKTWEQVESGNRHNGFFVGSFYVQWVMDSGYIKLYLKKPTASDKNWYLKIVYPMQSGEQYKTTVKAKHFNGIIDCVENKEVVEADSWEVWVKFNALLKTEKDQLSDENVKEMRNALHGKLLVR